MTDKSEMDFSDIFSGGKTTTKSEKKINEPVQSKEDKTGIVLAIPVDVNVWINKDLTDCTGEEFVAWARDYYPIDFEEHILKLNDLRERKSIFKGILAYHEDSPFQMGKDNKKNTNIN